MKLYSMTDADMTVQANEVKEALTAAMEREGFLKCTTAKEFNETYAVVFVKPGFFGKVWDKVRGVSTGRDGWHIHVMRGV